MIGLIIIAIGFLLCKFGGKDEYQSEWFKIPTATQIFGAFIIFSGVVLCIVDLIRYLLK